MHVSSGSPKNDSGARFVLIGTNNPFSGSLDESPCRRQELFIPIMSLGSNSSQGSYCDSGTFEGGL